ncbi:MAG TPA: SRPBCC family protein [Acidimicrobiales bacterium]|nr:SRPBCC family protein [Acidimicrobiales bacterium]
MNDHHLQGQTTINRSPADVYDAIADITQMGRWSPECTGGRWLGRAKEATVGARFVGFNKRKWARWATVCKVVTANPGKEFAFKVVPSGATWRYRFEPSAGGGTLVTETRELDKEPAVVKLADKAMLGGNHEVELDEGIVATLERVKAELER